MSTPKDQYEFDPVAVDEDGNVAAFGRRRHIRLSHPFSMNRPGRKVLMFGIAILVFFHYRLSFPTLN